MNSTKLTNDKSINIHKNHRTRMKDTFLKSGFHAFSDIEKLEMILFYAINQKDTNPIAHKLLDEFKSLDKVLEAPIDRLKRIEGLGEHSAILLKLFLDVANEYGKSKNGVTIKGTIDSKNYCSNLFKGKYVEEFYVICLNSAGYVVNQKLMNSGTSNEVKIEISSITNFTLNNNSNRIIIAHNHPYGEARPSDEDLNFTNKIMMSCLLNDIDVLDHIVVSKNDAYSVAESGLLEDLRRDALRKCHIPVDKSKLNQKLSTYIIGE